jgi:hypothetical protein
MFRLNCPYWPEKPKSSLYHPWVEGMTFADLAESMRTQRREGGMRVQIQRQIEAILPLLAVWVVFLVAFAPATTLAGEMSDPERRGYEQWLHSLEQTVLAQQEAETLEMPPLYPSGTLYRQATEPSPHRYLAIGRALAKMEEAQRLPEAGRRVTTFHALGMARSYARLCEYDSALTWYERAAHHDTLEAYADVIARESLASAIGQADSLRIVQGLLNTVGTSELADHEEELVLAYRFLLSQDDESNLRLLAQKVARLDDNMNATLSYWHAFALTSLREWREALPNLLRLVAQGGLSCGLTVSQRTWVAKKIPDLLFLLDSADMAAPLYARLAASPWPPVRLWGEYQLANLAFLDRRYGQAWVAFKNQCEGQEDIAWREDACLMKELAAKLSGLPQEGGVDGATALDNP